MNETPEAGLPQGRSVILAGLVEAPGACLPVQVVAAVVRDDDLLAEPVIAAWGCSPVPSPRQTPDQGQQGQQCVVEIGALAQIRRIRDRDVIEGRDVAVRGLFGALDRRGDRAISAAGDVAGSSSRIVGDQTVDRVDREPRDHDDRHDQQNSKNRTTG